MPECSAPRCLDGESLPLLAINVGHVQMFYFAAAVYNGHRIHYDQAWAEEAEGYPGLVVQGHLQQALLARAITEWTGPWGRLETFAVQNRGAAFVGADLIFSGTVTRVDELPSGQRVTLAITGSTSDGEVILPGTATVMISTHH